jgi:hypothetical protein
MILLKAHKKFLEEITMIIKVKFLTTDFRFRQNASETSRDKTFNIHFLIPKLCRFSL